MYGYYNHASKERKNKSALHTVKCYTDVILIIMVSSHHPSAMSCMRAVIPRIIFASPKVLYTIKLVSKFFSMDESMINIVG